MAKEKTKQVNLTDKEIIYLKECIENIVSAYPENNRIIFKIIKKLNRSQNKKRIKISSGKAKGRSLQQWGCRQISLLTGISYNQSDDSCEIHSREMGQHGTDIVLRGRAAEIFPFSIECKNAESFNIKETVKQAKQNQKEKTAMMIIYKCKEFKFPVVIMEWDTFNSMCKDMLTNSFEIRI